jgi:hypothetical protein
MILRHSLHVNLRGGRHAYPPCSGIGVGKNGGRPSGGTGVGRPQGSATGEAREPNFPERVFRSKSSGAAGLQEKLDVPQRFNKVSMTDQANQIFRSRTGFSVSPEDQQRCLT